MTPNTQEPPTGFISSQTIFQDGGKHEALTRLVGGWSHDLNNMLAIIEGHSSILQFSEALSEDSMRSVEDIKHAADRAIALIRKVLIYSRRQRLSISRFRLTDLLMVLLPELRDQYGPEFELRLQSLNHQCEIEADRNSISDCISELVANAKDSMEKGGVIVLEIVRDPSPLEQIRLTVTDQGSGISTEVLPQIFDPYYTTKSKGRHKGLGLSICAGIAEMHSGWIELQTKAGKGTTAHLVLPAMAIAKPVKENTSAPKSPSATSTRVRYSETILVVDDDYNLLSLVTNVLSGLGYQIIPATSLTEARIKWKEHKSSIAIALVDIVLPEGRVGLDFAEEILGESPNLPVILMSGFFGSKEETQRSDQLGCAFIGKPFDFKQLANLIRTKLTARDGI